MVVKYWGQPEKNSCVTGTEPILAKHRDCRTTCAEPGPVACSRREGEWEPGNQTHHADSRSVEHKKPSVWRHSQGGGACYETSPVS